tara:strand:- start:1152 stop:2174 length:1023 start_codon:yes stop_codon:yes gene_type:complete
MCRRKITKTNSYPTFVGKDRHINSILRNDRGYIVKPIFDIDGNFIKYVLTDIKDSNLIKPDSYGKRGRGVSRLLKSITDNNIVEDNYSGDLYMYCIHCPNQTLKSVDEFTTNRTQKTTICRDGLCRQSFCRDCKKTYVNSGPAGNSSRTQNQFLEDCGARLRGITFRVLNEKNKVDYKRLWEKYNGKCFKCNQFIPFENTGDKGLDHTLPHSLYWNFSTEDSTLLCTGCNGSKNNKWPSEFYTKEELINLSKMTGIDLDTLNGNPHYNPKVVEGILNDFDNIMNEWSTWGRKKNKKNSFSKFLLGEIRRMKKYNVNKNTNTLIERWTDYYNTSGKDIYGE